MPFGQVFDFADVFQNEIDALNKRRAAGHQIELEEESRDTHGKVVKRPTEKSDIIGLALSGGGIRSASFCLGALQALHTVGALDKVDYLSTVSGGGYIGASFTAAMHESQGEFPFESKLAPDETTAVQHIRDHSNYLFAGGVGNILDAIAIYVRGLVVNAALILPWLLLAAALTIYLYPNSESLSAMALGTPLMLTAYVALVAVVLFFIWGTWPALRTIVRDIYSAIAARLQRRKRDDRAPHASGDAHPSPKPTRPIEVPRPSTKMLGALVVVILVLLFLELQPLFLYDRFHPPAEQVFCITCEISRLVQGATIVLAPFAAIIAFVGRSLGEILKGATESQSKRSQLLVYVTKAAIYVAAAFVPLFLWAIYLQLSYWGIEPYVIAHQRKTPEWLVYSATTLAGFEMPIAKLYVAAALPLLAAMFFLRPNSNSLHPLYRDRLSKAFLFTPKTPLPKGGELSEAFLKLSDLSERQPYHLINTALNIQGSKTANRRGRNADFFIFSRNFCGSEATGYVRTKELEQVATEFDLATAMAVSGAAASSNMGAASIKPLTPTLAILNVRLGYWLRNPRQIFKQEGWNKLANFYFVAELFGLLNEYRKSVYLTDGGHIENLGIYELLKRRCKVIIAVDAEADQEMAFGSLNTMERYARIDLGVRIDLPWQKITNVTRATAKSIDETGDCPKLAGPHCAIGDIEYPGNRRGVLVYIKSSLTGDENDYVFHYRRRYPRFPHETTLDQMFSEEQFEAYRALGYHATYGLFDRRDTFAHLDLDECPHARAQVAMLDRLFPRVTTGGPPSRHPHMADRLPAAPAAGQADAT
jgi:Patatin-like phospholipase